MKKKFMVVLVVISLFMFMPYRVSAVWYGAGCPNTQTAKNGQIVNISCGGVTTSAQIYEVGNNNENDNDSTNKGGIFGNDACYIKQKQLDANNNGLNQVYYYARSNSGHKLEKIEVAVYLNEKETCGTYTIASGIDKPNANIKFSDINFGNSNSFIRLIGYTDENKTFSMDFDEYALESITGASTKEKIEDAFNENVAGSTKTNVKEDTQDKTISEKVERLEGLDDKDFIGTGKKNIDDIVSNSCDNDLKNLIEKYWKWVMFLTPILLIVMITIDFIKAMSLGDADSVKKSSNDAIKRVIAGILLLALPWLLEVIFGWFGLQLCF